MGNFIKLSRRLQKSQTVIVIFEFSVSSCYSLYKIAISYLANDQCIIALTSFVCPRAKPKAHLTSNTEPFNTQCPVFTGAQPFRPGILIFCSNRIFSFRVSRIKGVVLAYCEYSVCDLILFSLFLLGLRTLPTFNRPIERVLANLLGIVHL